MADLQQVVYPKLKAQVRLMLITSLLRLVFGIPIALLGPLILGSTFWFAAWQLGLGGNWTTYFLATSVVLLPLLIGLERRTAGQYLSETVAQSQSISPQEAGVIEAFGLDGMLYHIGKNPRASLAGVVEIFLIGPRMLIKAWSDGRVALSCGSKDLQHAAQVVAVLYRSGSGIPPSQLLGPQDDPTDFRRPILYLAHQQWIGLAANGEKLWLTSDIRQQVTRWASAK